MKANINTNSTGSIASESIDNDSGDIKLQDVLKDRFSIKEHHHKDVGMPAIGKTLVFPREDNIYTHKESIPYDEV